MVTDARPSRALRGEGSRWPRAAEFTSLRTPIDMKPRPEERAVGCAWKDEAPMLEMTSRHFLTAAYGCRP